MKFLSKLFGHASTKEKARQLDSPEQLRKGDLITLDDSFALPALLRGQTLEIKQINTYEYEHSKAIEWVLQGSTDDILFLSLENGDVPELIFSLKISRDIVGQTFDLEQFSLLFEQDNSVQLTVKDHLQSLTQWLADDYRQCEFAQFGYFHSCDYRQQALDEQQGESFERYSAISDNNRFSIEAEVFEGGETDVLLCIHRPVSDIRQYWPKS